MTWPENRGLGDDQRTKGGKGKKVKGVDRYWTLALCVGR